MAKTLFDFKRPLRRLSNFATSVLLVVLAGCGGGGGSASPGDSVSTAPPPSQQGSVAAAAAARAVTLNGAAVASTIAHGSVSVYLIVDGAKAALPAATGSTDANGQYTVNIPNCADPCAYLLEVTGGTYIDEATGQSKTVDASTPIRAIGTLDANATSATISPTPLTELATRIAESDGDLDTSDITAANTQVGQLFLGVDSSNAEQTLLTTMPAVATNADATNATETERMYGLMLAAVSQLDDLPDALTALATDAADGNLDQQAAPLKTSLQTFLASDMNNTGLVSAEVLENTLTAAAVGASEPVADSRENDITAIYPTPDPYMVHIRPEEKTVTVVMPEGTDVTALNPTLVLSFGATVSPSTPQDFTNPVTYTVTAQNGATQDWTVSITALTADAKSPQKDIVSMSHSALVSSIVNATQYVVTGEVTTGGLAALDAVEDLTTLFELSAGASIAANSGSYASGQVTYTVTAADESTQQWTVRLTEQGLQAQPDFNIADGTYHELQANADDFTLTTEGGHSAITTEYSSDDATIATISTEGVVTLQGAGSVTLSARKPTTTIDGVTFQAALAQATVVVNKATQSALQYNNVAQNLSTGTYQTEPAQSGSGTGALSFTSSDSSIVSVNDSGLLTFQKAGTVTIIVTKAADAKYLQTSTTFTVTVSAEKAAQTGFSAGDDVSKTFGEGTFTQAATGGSGDGAVTYQSDAEAVATVNATSGEVTIKGAGSATITATKAGDESFLEAQDSYQLTVAKANQSGFSAGNNREAVFAEGASYTQAATGGQSTGAVSYESNNTDVATVAAGGVVTLKGAGSATITATKAGDSNFNPISSSYTLTVAKADQSGFSAGENQTKTYAANGTYTQAASGGQSTGAVSYESNNTDVATVAAGGVVTLKGAGSATITATKAGDSNFNPISSSYTLTVAKADQSGFSAGENQTKTYAANGTYTQAASGGQSTGAVSYESNNTNVATVAVGGVVTLKGAGSATITATKAGDSNFNLISSSYVLTVTTLPNQSFSGVVSNNRVANATLTLCPINNGVKETDTCQTLASADNGSYAITLENFAAEAVWAEATGGSYTDEATGTVTTLSDPLIAVSVLDDTFSYTLHITPFTHMAVLKMGSDLSNSNIVAANAAITTAFFGAEATLDILTTEPVDVTDADNPATPGDAADYGLGLGMLSQLRENRSLAGITETLVEMLQALVDDLNDDDLFTNANREALGAAVNQFIVSPRNASGLVADDTVLDAVHQGDTPAVAPTAFAQNEITLTLSVGSSQLAQEATIATQQVANHAESAPRYIIDSTVGSDVFVINATTGEVTLSSTMTEVGTYTAQVTAANAAGGQGYGVSLVVDARPVAQDLDITTNQSIASAAGGGCCILGDCEDPDAFPSVTGQFAVTGGSGDIAYTIVSQPDKGEITGLISNGAFFYTPGIGACDDAPTGQPCTTSFVYRATDENSNSSDATVTIRINRLPVIGDLSFDSANLTAGVENFGVLDFYDPDGDPITIEVLVSNSGEFNVLNQELGTISYAPSISQGSRSIPIELSDSLGGATTKNFQVLINSPVTLEKFPVDLQLYPRDVQSNAADVAIAGVSKSEAIEQVEVRVLDRETGQVQSIKTVSLLYVDGSAQFEASVSLPAMLKNYAIELYGISGNGKALLASAKDVVAGDVYIFAGQSNARSGLYDVERLGLSATQLDDFIRTYGDAFVPTIESFEWQHASARGRGESQIGDFALKVAKSIITNHQIPVAIFNGAVGGTTIAEHMPNVDKYKFRSIYGHLLTRLTRSGFSTSTINGLVWYQGESDYSNESYSEDFMNLKAQWAVDYPDISYFYVMQPRACNHLRGDIIAEQIRQVHVLDETIRLMSATAVDEFPDQCHYSVAGYHTHGEHVYNLIARDSYDVAGVDNISAPNIVSAVGTGNTITLTFDQADADTLLIEDGAHTHFIVNGSLNVLSAAISPTNQHAIVLSLDGSASSATHVTFGADDAPWVMNGGGVGILNFTEFPVMQE